MMMARTIKTSFSPLFVSGERTSFVMLDVVISLLPLVFFGILCRGADALMVFGVSVLTAVLTEFVCHWIFLKKTGTLWDGSAVITSVLLALTLSPLTPWYVVAFGSFAAIFFGKVVWGGLGKNQFNPALVGREMMVVFFPLIMGSGMLWSVQGPVNLAEIRFFTLLGDHDLLIYLDHLLYKTSGALGEYSMLFLILGGCYLLIRRRISWHIPVTIIVGFFLMSNLFLSGEIRFSVAGLLLGAIYMATDMPSSPNTGSGKIFYGLLIAAVAVFCIGNGIKHEFMSYAILIGNAFTRKINNTFVPVAWGQKLDWEKHLEAIFLLLIMVIALSMAVVQLHQLHATYYLLFIYIVFTLLKFSQSFTVQSNHQKI
ncbi:RnfABCDGE type electron transport complex subunit D [Pedobacter sp. AW31-3R]|uniref:RnfABCDGE type electron transport complex subunit D n=1 Tax=Pedobacter sp. AW31-3R TaxID=3445781 RepID=UPI003FA0EFDF